jgi:hypothetical protein
MGKSRFFFIRSLAGKSSDFELSCARVLHRFVDLELACPDFVASSVFSGKRLSFSVLRAE